MLLQKIQWEAISRYRRLTLSAVSKKEMEQRRTKVGYCGWRKGTSRDEVTLTSEEINPAAALSIVELCLSGDIS